MNKRQIKELVTASFPKGKLDAKIAEKIAHLLSRKDLKAYVRGLKLEQQKRQIIVAMPSARLYNTSKKNFESIFSGKDLIFFEEEDLLLGIRITDEDIVYDLSLKEEFDKIKKEMNEYYSS